MRSVRVRKLVVAGLLLGVIIALDFSGIGLISTPVVAITVLHIPVIIGTLVEGLSVGVPLGLCFGLYSMMKAYIAPTGILSPLFQNPLISVLPRMMIPIVAYGVYRLALRVFKAGKAREYIAAGLSGFFGSVTNTVLVLGMVLLVYYDTLQTFEGGAAATIASILSLNSLIEAVAAVVISIPLAKALRTLIARNNKQTKT